MKTSSRIITALLVALLAVGFIVRNASAENVPVTSTQPGGLRPAGAAVSYPGLDTFIAQVRTGNGSQVTGVFVPNLFAFPVLQQPSGNLAFVANQPGVVTQFGMAASYGTVGLLAHNNQAGDAFDLLHLRDVVILVYGDGHTRPYRISGVQQYQALNPLSPYSDFLDLNQPASKVSAAQLFNQVYTHGDQVVFQTCIEKDGNPSWGRLFISAQPMPSTKSVGAHITFKKLQKAAMQP